MKRNVIFVLILLLILSGCGKEEPEPATVPVFELPSCRSVLDTIPADSYNVDFVYMEHTMPADSVLSAYTAHISRSAHYYGDGVILSCADPQERNQGSHYDAFSVRDGQLSRNYFLQEYMVLGNSFVVSFEYVLYNGNVIFTYVPAAVENWRLLDLALDSNQCLLLLQCFDVDGDCFSYPAILNVKTGEVEFLLASMDSAMLPKSDVGILNLYLTQDKKILARTNENRYHYYDPQAGEVFDLAEVIGSTLKTCAIAGDKIICQNSSGDFLSVDRETMGVEAMVLDIAETVFFNGIQGAGNQTYVLYRDVAGVLRYLDFLTMEDGILSEPAEWTVCGEMLYPSYDGRKAFQFQRDPQGVYQVLIFDCDQKQLTLLNRENANAVEESMIHWARGGELVIATDTGSEFYVYHWKEMEQNMNELTKPGKKEYRDTDFVPVADYIPDLLVDMKYAFSDNFTGHTIYEFQEAYLRYGTVKKLMAAQEELKSMGYQIKLWDAFRPVSAQFKLWEILPDDTYVANPLKGFSPHSRGNTVDITMVKLDGSEVEMPTEFDDFSTKADRDYSDNTETAAANAMILQTAMEHNGFKGYFGEWWHFVDEIRYEVEHTFDPAAVSVWYADCREYISLRATASTSAEVIDRIPVRESVTVLGYDGDFALVDFRTQRGYVLSSYLRR